MNALAIDCATQKLSVAAKKDSKLITLTLDIGTKQSEKVLPAIDYILKELDLAPKAVDYTSVTLGPGTFTGLRLGLSTLKALNLAYGIPTYGIPTLEYYAYPYRNEFPTILSVLEAKEGEYYYQFFSNGAAHSLPADDTAEHIITRITPNSPLLICGSGSQTFCAHVSPQTRARFLRIETHSNDVETLFSMAELLIAEKKQALADYEGPLYVRKSEAEIVHEQNVKADASTV